jgi:integrase
MTARGAAAASIKQLHAILHKMLKQALRWSVVPRNVADLVTPPRIPKREMHVLSADEARCLLKAARDEPLEALYLLALTTGMRQGELVALCWKDVDLASGSVRVQRTMHVIDGARQFSEPKSASSRRRIELTQTAIAALSRHRARQAEARLFAGSAWQDNDLVFTNAVGEPIDATNLLRHRFYPLLAKAGLPKIRFHDLRHTAATLLMSEGIHAKIVSEMLGHSTIAITLDLYSHVTPTMQKEAARAMDGLLGT